VTVRIPVEELQRFVTTVFIRAGLPEEDAAISAEILLAADLRGFDSHGVARLDYYVNRLAAGAINVRPQMRVVAETPATVAFDADNGIGFVAGYRAMRRCIEKARETGLCLATVRRSNHYGIAGYYATMALEEPGMIGVSMTNATPLVVPPFARDAYLSTAPIAFAIPAGKERPLVFDGATSTVAWGKIEIARRKREPIPLGWALDADGKPTTDPLAARYLTPLGAFPELRSHKGYALALLVEVLCGQLAGGVWAKYVGGSRSQTLGPSGTGHAFMAIRVDVFRPLEEFLADMDDMLGELRRAQPAEGAERVLVPGDLEYETERERRATGIPLHPEVLEKIRTIAEQYGIPAPA
jgi:LDH2 family malate/lactate/ureidoglycolate dehydrogenase